MDDRPASTFNDKEQTRFGRDSSDATILQRKLSHQPARSADKPKPVFPPHLGTKPR